MDQIYWGATWLGYIVMAITLIVTLIGLISVLTTPLTSKIPIPAPSQTEVALTSKLGASRSGNDNHFAGLDLYTTELCEKDGNNWIVAGGPFDARQSYCKCKSHYTGSACDIQLYDQRYTAVAQGPTDSLTGNVLGRVITPYISFNPLACTTQCDKTSGCEAVYYDGRNCILVDDRGIQGELTYDPNKPANIYTRGTPVLRDGISYTTDIDRASTYVRHWIKDKHRAGGFLRPGHIHRLDTWPVKIDNPAGHTVVIADDYFEGDQWKRQDRTLTFSRELPIQPPGWAPPYYMAIAQIAF